eukprot:gnl/Spiro4/14789_TR7972_c0_g1_i1.p1 gnl/Spiro4/14789_TR7972_c0_g1~~gnl/Spiro4/14789_TR7972_c0_g1_i1.p1  ORF type:complete len:628 (+),score=134.26 gnl/Spiro4/14789_TR7972_c0_g1_i1:157-2040(+)
MLNGNHMFSPGISTIDITPPTPGTDEGDSSLNSSLDRSLEASHPPTSAHTPCTPLPLPELSAFEDNNFLSKSHKKRTQRATPNPPVKSPPVSRLFTKKALYGKPAFVHNQNNKPHSFFTSDSPDTPETPPICAPNASYFEENFEICGILGRGWFAEVYKVKERSTGNFYAVKKSLKVFRGATDRERALNEVKALKVSSLHGSPYCIKYYMAWEEQGHLFVQTELCEYGNLDDYLHSLGDGCFLPENIIWNFLLDLALGIQHIHEASFMHLDIKPANIFLSSNGDLKIGDFGLARSISNVEDEDRESLIEGDASYVAPELLNGCFSFAADIFSFGATLFEMAAHVEMPSKGPMWHSLRQGNITLPPGSPPRTIELVQLISWMMVPNPAERPTITQVLHHPIVARLLDERNTFGSASAKPLFLTTSLHRQLAFSPVIHHSPSFNLDTASSMQCDSPPPDTVTPRIDPTGYTYSPPEHRLYDYCSSSSSFSNNYNNNNNNNNNSTTTTTPTALGSGSYSFGNNTGNNSSSASPQLMSARPPTGTVLFSRMSSFGSRASPFSGRPFSGTLVSCLSGAGGGGGGGGGMGGTSASAGGGGGGGGGGDGDSVSTPRSNLTPLAIDFVQPTALRF